MNKLSLQSVNMGRVPYRHPLWSEPDVSARMQEVPSHG